MSLTKEISKTVSLTWFWGGDKKKRCIQITKKDKDLSKAYQRPCYKDIELTLNEMKKLIETFVKEERDKYPKRDRKCVGCGRTFNNYFRS